MVRSRARTVGRPPKPPLYDAVFADALQAAMTRAGLAGPTALADAAGIGHASASGYLLRQRLPDRGMVPKLAVALGVAGAEVERWIAETRRLDEVPPDAPRVEIVHGRGDVLANEAPVPYVADGVPPGASLETLLRHALALARRTPADEEHARQLLIDRLRSDPEIDTLMLKEPGGDLTFEELVSLVKFGIKARAGAKGDE